MNVTQNFTGFQPVTIKNFNSPSSKFCTCFALKKFIFFFREDCCLLKTTLTTSNDYFSKQQEGTDICNRDTRRVFLAVWSEIFLVLNQKYFNLDSRKVPIS